MNQRDGVYAAIVAVRGELNGEVVTLTRDEKDQVRERVFAGFKSGVIEHKNLPDDAALLKYIPGLINNWTRKDTRLNGGDKYVTKNPGSRSGTGDPAIQAMKVLLANTKDSGIRKQIQVELDKRVAELKPVKVINVEALPESLRHLVG